MRTARRSLLRPAPALALLALAVGGCASSGRAGAADLAARLTAQAAAWDRAIVGKDSAAIAANMAPEFRHISESGRVSDGPAFLHAILAPPLSLDPYGVEEADVRVYGDVALVFGRTRMTGRYDGRAFASDYRFVDTYVRRGGRWRVANVQISPVGE